jgi:hypothetical protein
MGADEGFGGARNTGEAATAESAPAAPADEGVSAWLWLCALWFWWWWWWLCGL